MRRINRSITAVALVMAAPAFAQPVTEPQNTRTGTDQSADSGDIIVTAQRVETSLQRTPVALTALSGETLVERGATSLLDVQNSTPSLTVGSRSTAGSNRGGFTIRGIGVDSVDGSAAVGIYVDEVYYPSQAGNLLGLFDVARVEVLRGPQGTLFGRNTIAGAVQYITAKPDFELGGFATGTVSTRGRYELAGALNLPITDTLAVRVSARYNELGGYVFDELNEVDRGAETTKQARAQIRWEPTPEITIDVKGEYIDQTSNGRALAILDYNRAFNPACGPGPAAVNCFRGPGSVLVDFGILFGFNPAQLATIRNSGRDYRNQGFNSPEFSEFDYRSVQGNIVWDLNESLTLKSITAYSYSYDHALVDIDLTALPIFAIDRGETVTRLLSQEVQLSGSLFDDRLDFTIGGYYFRQTSVRDQLWQYPGLGFVVVPVTSDTRLRSTALAAYGQLTYKFTDRLSLSAGLRYSDERARGSFLNTLAPAPAAPVVVGGPAFPAYSISFDDLSPSVGLNFQVTPDALIYAKASKGFRAGGLAFGDAILNPPPPSRPGYVQFDQETAWTYELGTRLQFLDRRISINPTVFLTDWKNIQFNTFVFAPSPIVVTQNAGDARIWGIELELRAQVSDAFSINSAFSYLNAEYTSVLPAAPVTLTSDLQRAPPLKFSLGAQYRVPLDNGDEFLLSADYAFNDRQRSATSDADAITIPAYGLLNARLGYTFSDLGLNVAVYGTNLTDTYYYIGGTNGFGTFGGVEADLGRRREIGVNLRLDF